MVTSGPKFSNKVLWQVFFNHGLNCIAKFEHFLTDANLSCTTGASFVQRQGAADCLQGYQ